MTEPFFRAQMIRLTDEWPKSFSAEKQKLIAKALRDLPDYTVEKIVTHFLLTSRHAPLPQDFLDASYKERKRSFDRDVQGAVNEIFDWSEQKGLRAFLDEHYPGAECLMDAVLVERIRLKKVSGD